MTHPCSASHLRSPGHRPGKLVGLALVGLVLVAIGFLLMWAGGA